MASPGKNLQTGRTLSKTRILVVDDHPVFRFGLSNLIDAQPNLTVCGQAGAAPQALDAVRKLDPDLVVLDVSLPGTNGIELIKLIKAEKPHLAILVVSMHDETLYGLRGLKAGALGYVMKSEAMDHIVEAIAAVMAGKVYVSPKFSEKLIFRAIQSADSATTSPVDLLSDREIEVLHLIGKGHSSISIAKQLHRSVKTIETHRAHIKEKLGCRDSEEMVRFAIDWVAQQH